MLVYYVAVCIDLCYIIHFILRLKKFPFAFKISKHERAKTKEAMLIGQKEKVATKTIKEESSA